MSKGSDKIPHEEEALELLIKYGVDKKIIEHSKVVYKKALEIAEKIIQNGIVTLNMGLISAGALLHDIGRYNENSIRHGVVGGDLLRNLGYSPELARIVERHVLCGVSKRFAKKFGFPADNKYIPETTEELIICFADKLVAGQRSIGLKRRYNAWITKYGKTPLLEESMKRIERIKKKILNLMGEPPTDSSHK
ncbi:MAG: HDIG domain-containing metalloprotein [Promethearchaeota archaeon]